MSASFETRCREGLQALGSLPPDAASWFVHERLVAALDTSSPLWFECVGAAEKRAACLLFARALEIIRTCPDSRQDAGERTLLAALLQIQCLPLAEQARLAVLLARDDPLRRDFSAASVYAAFMCHTQRQARTHPEQSRVEHALRMSLSSSALSPLQKDAILALIATEASIPIEQLRRQYLTEP